MAKYWIAPTDYGGTNNDKYPRWRVYTWNRRREPWGHIGNHPVSDYFWTDEEAREELDRLERKDAERRQADQLMFLVVGGVVLSIIIIAIVLSWLGIIPR